MPVLAIPAGDPLRLGQLSCLCVLVADTIFARDCLICLSIMFLR